MSNQTYSNYHPWATFYGGSPSLWETDPRLDSLANVNFAVFLIQTSACAALSVCLLVCGCRYVRNKTGEASFTRYPLHSLQWMCMLATFLLHLCSISEGLLTDATYRTNAVGELHPTQPHLYIPPICGLFSTCLTMIYYHHMEVWRAAHMAWLLLAYWSLGLAEQALSLVALLDYDVSLAILRLDVCLIGVFVSFLLVLLQLNVIRVKLFYKTPNSQGPPTDMKFTQEFCNFPSEYTFWWLNWLFRLGYKRPVEKEDLGCLPDDRSASYIHNQFRDVLKTEQSRAKSRNCQISLWRVYLRIHGWRMVFALILKVTADIGGLVGPLAIINIIAWVGRVQDGSQIAYEPHFVTVPEFFENGLVLVGVIFVVSCTRGVLMQTYEFWIASTGIKLRSAIQTMVFEKSLRVSTFIMTSGHMTIGQITNHMSTDAMNVVYMCQYMLWLASLPLQLAMIIGLLIMQLELSALLGVAVFVVVIPAQFIMGNYMARMEKKSLAYADCRIKMSNEVLQGIKLLKMYGWEELFGNAIERIRRSEIWTVTKMMTCYATLSSVTDSIPLIVTLTSFGTLGPLTGKVLTPDLAFSSVALFNRLRTCLFLFPVSLFTTINGVVSTRRVAAFLSAPEINMTVLEVEPSPRVQVMGASRLWHGPTSAKTLGEGVAIRITNGQFSWDPESTVPILSDINLSIPEGKLTMVFGTVGSGKSSVLSAILEEMVLQRGSLQLQGTGQSIAYSGQKAWLINSTLKENILFGRPLYQKKYRDVIAACALQTDIDMLPAGDRTEIGEKGINVSGGQKQRISVARAIYSGREIVLLDDPLSALDVHVGDHLFQQGIMGILRMKKRTVILVTHQLQYLPYADQIVLMKDGRIAATGTFDDIVAIDPELYQGYQRAIQKMTEESEVSDSQMRRQELSNLKRQISRSGSLGKAEVADDTNGRLMASEEREHGSVSWGIYFFYARAITVPAVLAIFALYPVQAAINAVATVWLSEWTDTAAYMGNETDTGYFVKIYACLSGAGIAVSFVTNFTLVVSLLLAARKIFNYMLQTIIHMPMRFFDTTPIGRIINRFAADIHTIDLKLSMAYIMVLFQASAIAAAVILNTIINPIFLAAIVPLLFIYYYIRKVAIMTSRELQRLDSVYKSPIFATFSETLGGLSTIRAYRKQKSFFDDIILRVSSSNTIYLYLQSSVKWLGLRLDFIGSLVVLVAGLSTILGAIYGNVTASEVGLGVSYALMISASFQLVVRFMAEAEMNMNAVERVSHYTGMTMETYEGKEPPPTWPDRGCISLDGISVRYAKDLEPVLKDISITVDAGQKVGICGRTGSGKSSLTLALYRIIDTYKGRIVIDDIDIATIPLRTLRQRLAIIPQDPVLFDGTIRMNLDPQNLRTEQELWDALEIAQLKELVMLIDGGLDSQVAEGGETFSAGQRQLFCLARAFLRNTPILIMDEATASIDVETDKTLQRVVATAFSSKTVLTIAHRVATILNSDLILTLSQGRLIEHDTPDNLLSDSASVFASLVNSGL